MNGENDITTVFIIAASAIARAGLEAVLGADENFIIAGSAAETPQAPPAFLIGQTIDVLLVNVEREKELDDLLDLLSDNAAGETDFPRTIALFAPELQTSEVIVNALQNNLPGILPHDASAEQLCAAVKAVANDLIAFPPEFAEMILLSNGTLPNAGAVNPSQSALVENLTAREREVLIFLVEGESNKIIADRLNISEHTIKFHVASIFGKLGVSTRTEAATQAVRRGLILL